MNVKKVWINDDIFDWYGYGSGWTVYNSESWNRAYKIWNHCEYLFANEVENEFHRADGIANLKRCINHRLQLIERIYQFKSLNIVNKPKGSLELLESFGLVRPYIMKQLFEIRNDIEHRDEAPPSIERCNELLDVVWYFLKSTDFLVKASRSEGEYTLYTHDGLKTHYGYTIELDYEDIKNSRITGWFPEGLIKTEKEDGTLEIIVKDLYVKEELNDVEDYYHKDKLDGDKWVDGRINFGAHNVQKAIKSILSLF